MKEQYFFMSTNEDGRIVYGKRDPVTKEILEMYYYD